jgi:RHS repeat-associated protein
MYQWVDNPTLCKYDPVGRLWDPCDNEGNYAGYDGENAVRTGADEATYAWTFVHGPGLDDPVMGYNAGYGLTLYWVTDGEGRQYAVGSFDGYDYSTDNRYTHKGGKYAGGTTNAATFNADRNSTSEMSKVSVFRNRFYDQQTGRWTQEDPIGVAGGLNLYAYVGNNPVAYIDPFGLDCFDAKGNRIPCQPVPGVMRLARLNNSASTRGSGFVMRTREDGSRYQHQGADIAAAPGTDVSAMYDGVVTAVVNASNDDGDDAGYRITIRSKHDSTETTSYWHLSETSVNVGDNVQGGDVIGKSGTTGNADPAKSGREAHLHARRQVNGKDVNPGVP